MYKSIIFVCILCVVLIEGRPKWQFLPELPGFVPVYIRNGDTPLEEINPDLAEAFHALPSGRNVGKHLEAAPEVPEQDDKPQSENIPEASQTSNDIPYEKQISEKKENAFGSIQPSEFR